MTRNTFGKKNPNLPFHPAVRAGDFIFISGQVPKDAEGNMFSGTIEEETEWCIEAVRTPRSPAPPWRRVP
jgi:2-iminobutanoate/2-iminopropanoate deaminase